MAKTTTWNGAALDNDWATAGNWDNGVPAAGDTVRLSGDEDITVGLDQSAVTVASLVVEAAFSGAIGTAAAYLQIGATACRLGADYGAYGSPQPGGRWKINFGAVQTACVVETAAAVSDDDPLPPIRLLGTHAANTLEVRGGAVGIALGAAEVATFATIRTGATEAQVEAQVTCGAGVTLANFTSTAGRHELRCAAVNLKVHGGTTTTDGSGTVTAASVYGGTLVSNSTGTITGLTLYGGLADFLQSTAARTVTATLIYGGAINVDTTVVTLTAVSPNGRLRLTAEAA